MYLILRDSVNERSYVIMLKYFSFKSLYCMAVALSALVLLGGFFSPAYAENVTFQAGPGGTISGASLQSVPTGGSTLAVSAVPLPGWTFANWTSGGLVISTANPLTVTNVTSDMTVTANFTAPLPLTVTFQAGPGGTISPTASQTVIQGGSTSTPVTAVPIPGYTFVSWTVGGLVISTSNPLTVTNVTSDMTVTANFTAPLPLTVTFQAGPGGTISGASLQTVTLGGSTLAVSAVPLPGYTFANWTGTGGFLTTSLNPLTVSNVTASMTVTANFQTISNANVFFQAGPGGTISGASLQTVPMGGSTLAVTAVPNAGFQFVSWTVGGLVISTNNPVIVTNVIGDMTVTAIFQPVSNVSPVAMNGVLTTTSGVSANGLLSATDANGDYLTYRINQQGLKGTATLNPVGSANFTYMPSPGAVGTDSFLYIANDGKADSNVAMVMIDIQSVSPFVTRTFPAAYTPGVKLTVTLTVTPPSGTSSYSVKDKPPAGWEVSNISNGGVFDTTVNEVRFLIQNGNFAALTYDIKPPASETGDKIFSGTATRDGGASSVIGGKISISKGAQTHPADISSDFTLTDSEVTGYVSAWLRGNTWNLPPNPIPASYAVRAAGLWLGGTGGKYKFDSAVGNAPYCWLNTTNTRSQRDGTSSTAVRQLPSAYIAGQKVAVSIAVTFGTKNVNGAYSIEDQVPSGWAASDFMSDGKADNTAQFVNGKVQFFFYDKLSRTVSYKVMPPTGESGNRTFSGTASFFNEEITITGDSSVSDAKPAMGDVNGDGKVDLADAILALQVLAGLNPPDVNIGADVNNDGKIGLEEVIYILQKVAELR